MKSKEELIKLFQSVGCKDPDGWATSEAEEDIPQLSRFLVLKMMLAGVLEEGSGAKMAEEWRNGSLSSDLTHYARGDAAAKRLLDAGVDPNDLVDIVRAEQISLVCHIAYGLGNYAFSEEFDDFAWTLLDPQGREIGGLEESVNEMCAELCSDPSHHHF